MKHRRHVSLVHAAAFALAWALAQMGYFSVLLLPVVIWLVWQCVRKQRFVRATSSLLLCPLGVAYAVGCADYLAGTATLVTGGKADARSRGLDRETRAQKAAGGCLSDGSEWVRRVPYAAAVGTMVALFGPVPGSYAAEFPDEASARRILDVAGRASVGDNDLVLGANRFAIAPSLASWLRKVSFDPDAELSSLAQVRLDPRRHLILRGGLHSQHVIVVGNDKGAVLIERSSGHAFAYYGTFEVDELPPTWRDR